jgi:hypothetical protein
MLSTFIGTGITNLNAIFYKAIYILITGNQYLIKRAANLCAYPVGSNAVFHHVHIVFIQAGISTIITVINAISYCAKQFLIPHNVGFYWFNSKLSTKNRNGY